MAEGQLTTDETTASQNSTHLDICVTSGSDTTVPSTDVVTAQNSDADASLMGVAEMEQSPESFSNMDLVSTEIKTEDCEISQPSEVEASFPEEFAKFWQVVVDNAQDFTGWTYLLQYVEQENHVLAARKAFDQFFCHYPYCYGYWKKYADFEKRHGNIKEAEEVYQRGLQSIPLSVDLWIHYINFMKDTYDNSYPETNSRIRGAFEHAVLAAGTDFRSDRLWEMYINWETEQGNLAAVTGIYARVLGIPTQLYSHHFQRFKELIQNNVPKACLTAEEFLKLRRELAAASGHTNSGDAPPGDDLPPGIEDIKDPAKLITEIENMRHRIIEIHQEIFNHNEHEVSKRWRFEEGIKRPYFHVKPLEKAQLKNWKEYLDFEIENGTHERVVVLFERCLVACALYEEFWIKYAKYLESHSIEGVRHVYSRACIIHLPKKPLVHLLWAAFEEQQGNINEARRILKSFEESVPGLAMVRLRRVSLERRHGNLEEAELLLQDAIKNSKSSSESTFYSVKLARLLFKVQKNLLKARKVLLEAIEKDPESTKLYLNLLEVEYSGDLRQNEDNLLVCFDKAIHSSLPVEKRITFSQRKVEFLEDFGSDVHKLMEAYDEHQKLLKELDTLKRKAENGSEEPSEKKARTDDDAALSSAQMMSSDMQTSQAAYNYNAWYQYNYQTPWNYGQYYQPAPT